MEVSEEFNHLYDAPGFKSRLNDEFNRLTSDVHQDELPTTKIAEYLYTTLYEVYTQEDFAHYAELFYPYRKKFLKTYYWKFVKRLCIGRSSSCQICGSKEDLEVHHTNYKICGSEHLHLATLFVLCGYHHSEQHMEGSLDTKFGRNEFWASNNFFWFT